MKQEIKITRINNCEIDRINRNYFFDVSFYNGTGNLELRIEANQPFWFFNEKLEFADKNAFGSRLRIIEIKGDNGANRYAKELKQLIESEYEKQYRE